MQIVELRSEAELREAFSVIQELHGGLDERRYAELLAEMVPGGYRMFAVRDEGGVAAVEQKTPRGITMSGLGLSE